METWCDVLGRPLLDQGKTQVFGRGLNPINWVSAADVAEFVTLATLDPALRGEVIEVGGPDNLTMTAFVDVFRKETGSSGKVGHIPPTAMRLMALVMRVVNPGMARQIQMGVIMDTRPQAFDALETRRRYPTIPLTRLTEVVKRDYAEARGAAQGA
jgi:NADH dehydrogenase